MSSWATIEANLGAALKDYFESLDDDEQIASPQPSEQETETVTLQRIAFTLDDIFEEVRMITSYRARNRIDEPRETDANLDVHVLTRDEYDMFKRFLKKGAGKVFQALHSLTKNLFGAFMFDKSENLIEEDFLGDGKIIFYLQMNENWNFNLLTIFAETIEQALIFYILKEFERINHEFGWYDKDLELYEEYKSEAKALTYKRTKPIRRRTTFL